MTGYTDPAVKDETARILKELERIISEDSKQARDIVKTEYTELKRKVTESKNEKIEFIDQLESEKKAKISSLTTTYNGLRIAQDCSKKDDIDIIQKFLVLEKDLNRIRNSIMSQKINTEFHKDELSDSLKLFCVLNYGLPPGTQAIPPHNAPIEKPLQQQPADLPEKGDSSIDDFIRFVHTFKTLDFKPTLFSEIPIEIVNQSKQYVKYMNKYTLVKSYEIMRSSIQSGKLMNNVCTGFENLSRLANCIYFDPNSEETRIIQVDSVFYQDISNNLCNTDDVFQLLGYENKRQFWQLDNVSVSKFEARIERVFCELCLVVQESNAVEKQVPASGRLNFLTQMVEKSVKPGLPLPNSRPKPKEQEAATHQPETLEDEDDQYALSELQVTIDSVLTFDPKYKPSLAEAKPDDLFEEAQKCVRLPTKTKYQLIQMYEVIKSNLLANKTIQDIIQGLTGAFKYVYCQLFDLKSAEIQDLLYNEDPFLSLVSSKMVCYPQVFLSMGYTPLASGLGMVLNNPDRHNSSLVCCELLIGIQEMTELERTGHDPMKYFNLLKPVSRENLDDAHQQTVQPEKHPPPVQTQDRNIPCVAPQQATNVLPGSMEMQTASKAPPALKSHGHMPTPQTFPPTNIEKRQQHGSGQMLPPPNQGSGPIEPIPTPQTFPPTNIERRQQHGSGQMPPPNQGSGPIEPIPPQTFPPTNIERRQQHGSGQILPPPNQRSGPIEPIPNTQTYPPTNIDRRQQHGSDQMLPPPNQRSGPIEPIPTTRTYASPNIEPMQHASGPRQSYQTHGSQMQPKQTPGEPSTVAQTFNPGTIETSQMNKQNVSGQRYHDPSCTITPHEPTQAYNLTHQSSYPVSTQSNTGYSNIQDPSMGSSSAHGQGGKPPYGYKQGDHSQSHQSQNVHPLDQPSSAQNLHMNRSQEISQSSDPNRDNSPQRTQSGRLYAFEGQHPSFILLQDFENINNMCPNFQLMSPIPSFLVDLARNCLQLSAKDKFSNDLVGEIILTNLRNFIEITEICQGIEWLAKYCMCIYLRQPYTEVTYLKAGGRFKQEIVSRILLPTELYTFLGYVFNESDNMYHLEIEKIDANTVVQIGCDCLIAIQDLNEYKDIGHEKFILFFEQYEPISTYGSIVLSQQAVSQAQDHSMQQYQPNPRQAQSIAPYAGMNIQSQQPFSKPNETFAQGGSQYSQSYQQQQQQQHNYPMSSSGSQTEMNRWSCPHCTYANPGNKSICEKCYKSNNFNTEPFQVSTARQSTDIKYCDKCNHPNRMQDVNCSKCHNSIIHSMQ